MPGWINKIFGGTAVRGSVADAPAGWGSQLFELLKPVDQRTRPGTARDLLNYVLTGDPVSVLGVVAAPGAGQALGVNGNSRGEYPAIYRDFAKVPVDVRLRWCQVLQVCSQTGAIYALQLPGGAHWPEVLLTHASGSASHFGHYQGRRPLDISVACLEEMLVESGLATSSVLVSSFASPIESSYFAGIRQRLVANLIGYNEAVERHAEAIRPVLLAPGVPQRLHVLWLLDRAGDEALARFGPELVSLAVSSSKQVRAAAMDLVHRAGISVVDPLKQVAREGKPEERAHALRLLFDLGKNRGEPGLAVFARETAAADKAASVSALASQWEEGDAQVSAGGQQSSYVVPVIEWTARLTPGARAGVESFWRQVVASIVSANETSRRQHAQSKAAGHKFPLYLLDVPSEPQLKTLLRQLESDEPGGTKELLARNAWWHFNSALLSLAANPEMTPVFMLKTLHVLGMDMEDRAGELSNVSRAAFNVMHQKSGRPTLLELSEMFREIGVPPYAVLSAYCNSNQPLAGDWDPEAVWPFFAHNLDLVIRAVTHGTDEYWFDRTAPIRAIATLPELPQVLITPLFDLALGSAKTDRASAQQALSRLPEYEKRVVAALESAKAGVRTLAAQWLAGLRYEPAIPALEKACTKDKNDVAKGAILDALQALGQPVEKYLNRSALAKDAANLAGKPAPKELDWFPWSAIPQVRWADSGEPVESDILRWMLISAVKQKSPEPNAILRKYCSMFETRDREAFGQFILETWLREDVRPIDPEEALRQAKAEAQQMHRAITQYPQYYGGSPYLGKSEEEITGAILPRWMSTPAGSAIGSKGVLAVAAACAGPRAAPAVSRYLKEYYGTRAAQGKALIGMLAWIEHPSATQLMLSVGSRFRTKSFQEEAVRQAEALAERNNWTLAELSDRTVDSAGFDEDGEMELDYGGRRFTAGLTADLNVALFNEEGKKIASLPEPRQADDPDLAKQAKKTLAGIKKQLKNTVEQQTDRLYEALCTERDWSFEDWELYLNRHPVLRRLVQRLVWVEMDGDAVKQLFRPLEDGSLTDVDDEEVTVAPGARVRLAHDWLLEDAQVAKWQQHLADYEVKPLFQQLGKGRYALPAGKAGATIDDFEGHLIESFTLRGRATKLGYTRGQAGDGGWFTDYVKRFPTLGLEALIEFTGSPLPEESRTVALISLSFSEDRGGDYWHRAALPLTKVPKVLLSECYSDLRTIAGEGKGFDPDWRKKTEY